jgi:hypothetical protein
MGAGGRRGTLREAAGVAGGPLPAAEVATLSAVPAFIKEKGECREVGGDSHSSSGPESTGRGGRSRGRARARAGRFGVSESLGSPSVSESGTGERKTRGRSLPHPSAQ